jgi:hypothetical protein
MTFKGFDQLRKHIPDLLTPLGILYIVLLPVVLIILASILFNTIRFTLPILQLVAETLLGGLGFGLLCLFFRFKERF